MEEEILIQNTDSIDKKILKKIYKEYLLFKIEMDTDECILERSKIEKRLRK